VRTRGPMTSGVDAVATGRPMAQEFRSMSRGLSPRSVSREPWSTRFLTKCWAVAWDMPAFTQSVSEARQNSHPFWHG
jgi:hypothetical protein